MFVSVLRVRICPCKRCVSYCCVLLALSMSMRTLFSSFCTDFLVSAIFIFRTVSSVSFSPLIIVTCDLWYLISVRMSESLFYIRKSVRAMDKDRKYLEEFKSKRLIRQHIPQVRADVLWLRLLLRHRLLCHKLARHDWQMFGSILVNS